MQCDTAKNKFSRMLYNISFCQFFFFHILRCVCLSSLYPWFVFFWFTLILVPLITVLITAFRNCKLEICVAHWAFQTIWQTFVNWKLPKHTDWPGKNRVNIFQFRVYLYDYILIKSQRQDFQQIDLFIMIYIEIVSKWISKT